MREVVDKINGVVYQIERAIVVAAMMVMAILVFLDVAHRQWTSQVHKLGELLARFSGVKEGEPGFASLQDASPALTVVITLTLLFFAAWTASQRTLWPAVGVKREEPSTPRNLLVCAGIAVGAFLLIWLVLRTLFGDPKVDHALCDPEAISWQCGVFPSGLIWAQQVALVLTIWAGFLGASMAASDVRHLRVEAIQRALPEKARNVAAGLGWAFAAVFSLLVSYLSLIYVQRQHDSWIETEGVGARFDGTEIPLWAGFSILPVAMVLIAIRFGGTAILAMRGELREGISELGNVDLDELARQTLGSDDPHHAGETAMASHDRPSTESKEA